MPVDKVPLLPGNGRSQGGPWAFITSIPIRLREVYLNGPDRHWVFIGEIFFIVFLQLVVASAVATLVLKVASVANFFKSTWLGLILYILIILIVPIGLIFIYYERRRWPQNIILLTILILASGSAVGLICVYYTYGKVAQQTLMITMGTFAGLALYALVGSYFPIIRNMFFAFLWGTILIIGLFLVSQVCHNNIWSWLLLGGLSFNEVTLGALAAIVFCAYVVWDTSTIVGREQNAIWGSMLLYLDVVLKLWPVVKSFYDAAKPRGR